MSGKTKINRLRWFRHAEKRNNDYMLNKIVGNKSSREMGIGANEGELYGGFK